jgi:HSP20 family molecular chaperone IbpA
VGDASFFSFVGVCFIRTRATPDQRSGTIKGTKEQVAEAKAEKVHRYERTYGAFERTFRLSASIDPNKIKATYNLGVLTITLPKAETAKPHLIKVEVTAQKALKA